MGLDRTSLPVGPNSPEHVKCGRGSWLLAPILVGAGPPPALPSLPCPCPPLSLTGALGMNLGLCASHPSPCSPNLSHRALKTIRFPLSLWPAATPALKCQPCQKDQIPSAHLVLVKSTSQLGGGSGARVRADLSVFPVSLGNSI